MEPLGVVRSAQNLFRSIDLVLGVADLVHELLGKANPNSITFSRRKLCSVGAGLLWRHFPKLGTSNIQCIKDFQIATVFIASNFISWNGRIKNIQESILVLIKRIGSILLGGIGALTTSADLVVKAALNLIKRFNVRSSNKIHLIDTRLNFANIVDFFQIVLRRVFTLSNCIRLANLIGFQYLTICFLEFRLVQHIQNARIFDRPKFVGIVVQIFCVVTQVISKLNFCAVHIFAFGKALLHDVACAVFCATTSLQHILDNSLATSARTIGNGFSKISQARGNITQLCPWASSGRLGAWHITTLFSNPSHSLTRSHAILIHLIKHLFKGSLFVKVLPGLECAVKEAFAATIQKLATLTNQWASHSAYSAALTSFKQTVANTTLTSAKAGYSPVASARSHHPASWGLGGILSSLTHHTRGARHISHCFCLTSGDHHSTHCWGNAASKLHCQRLTGVLV